MPRDHLRSTHYLIRASGRAACFCSQLFISYFYLVDCWIELTSGGTFVARISLCKGVLLVYILFAYSTIVLIWLIVDFRLHFYFISISSSIILHIIIYSSRIQHPPFKASPFWCFTGYEPK